MDLVQGIFELIDMRSFSNLWFWIMLAILWSSTSHWVLGVPWDMVIRARRQENDQNRQDLHDIVRINCNRILLIAQEVGSLLAGFMFFVLTTLGMLGFYYDNEFSQAVFLLAMPMSMVAGLSFLTARSIRENELIGERLYRKMHHHRIITQGIGMVSIFVTAIWGMYQNYATGPLGG
ncbi:MAG: component of SufBCD complex [Pseudomonadota bacterium]